jgi:hypothetical protein
LLDGFFRTILEMKHFSVQARLHLDHVLQDRLELRVFIFELPARVVELDLEAANLIIFGRDILGDDFVRVAAIFIQELKIGTLFLFCRLAAPS